MAKLLCKLFGHKWLFLSNAPFTDNAGSEHWSYEFSKCSRCGAVSSELVAGPRG